MQSISQYLNYKLFISSVEVLATLTSDVGRILSKMHLVQPKGDINIVTGIRIAHVSSVCCVLCKVCCLINNLFSWC